MLNHKPLVLKNYMVNTLVGLLNIPLQANIARMRNRFVLLFNDTIRDLDKERMDLLKKYGDLNEKGELQVAIDGNYKMLDMPAFEKEFEELTNRVVPVACVGEQYADFTSMYRVLDSLETKLSVAETAIYNDIMEAFEEWAKPQHHE